MPWFWGIRSKKEEDDSSSHEGSSSEDEEYDSEEYSDEEDEESYTDEEDNDDNAEVKKESSSPSVEKSMNNGEETKEATTNADEESSPATLNGHLSPREAANEGDELSSPTFDDGVENHDDDVEYQVDLKDDGGTKGSTLKIPQPGIVESHSSSANSHNSAATEDDNVSMIESDGLHSGDEAFLDTSDDEGDSSGDEDEGDGDDDSSEEEEGFAPWPTTENSKNASATHESVQVETVGDEESDEDHEPAGDQLNGKANDDEEEEEGPTTFWEKQSLLALAAEHDRVDILKGILADDDQNESLLMNSGIPPLHIAISFGSTNATQSLLRMGADPSVRPNVAEVKKQALEAPEGSKLEIPNMGRFDGVTAWELAFGNVAYEEQQKSKSSSWSMFNTSSSNLSVSSNGGAAERVIKPVDMAPSKREGIRHAFTAEALRCIGGDEVQRLEQLLDSGMPASIDIGGKDLYDWAVQLGGLQCEEFLRPSEAAKHGTDIYQHLEDTTTPNTQSKSTDASQGSPPSAGKVLDRPGDQMTVPLLVNRLDELESLASALSTCLDNLAEEVSVCHGLLLMGGGASALASHVKSLKTMQAQKRTQLSETQAELEQKEQELAALVKSSGPLGEEVLAMAPNMVRDESSRTDSFRKSNSGKDGEGGTDDDDSQTRKQLLAQIAASENKILKLRASIADLSEENAREMEQVEKRGLTGGINLVRTLREELRDLEFQWNEAKNRIATCRAQIGMIQSRMPKSEIRTSTESKAATSDIATADIPGIDERNEDINSIVEDEGIVLVESEDAVESEEEEPDERSVQDVETSATESGHSGDPEDDSRESPDADASTPQTAMPAEPVKQQVMQDRPAPAFPGHVERKHKDSPDASVSTKTHSERIATGDSQALALRPSGRRGYFTVDLWQVLLRIIGMDQAANRRGAEASQKQKGNTANLMIV